MSGFCLTTLVTLRQSSPCVEFSRVAQARDAVAQVLALGAAAFRPCSRSIALGIGRQAVPELRSGGFLPLGQPLLADSVVSMLLCLLPPISTDSALEFARS